MNPDGVTVARFVAEGVPRADATALRDECNTLALLVERRQLLRPAARRHVDEFSVRLEADTGRRRRR